MELCLLLLPPAYKYILTINTYSLNDSLFAYPPNRHDQNLLIESSNTDCVY
jgi:hypothetical protein